ncbi:MAG TPA: alpha/beta hydrolase [Mycobacteriales bacterium]|nr:alpha/beta hydrolase [Mycobacteriales bacterium]
MRRLLTLVLAGCLAVAGLVSTAPADAATAARAPAIDWGACTDAPLVQAHAQCGLLAVPLDHARPAGPTIQLAVSRVLHTSPDSAYQGVVLVNPGGPGASGLGYATLGAAVPGHVGDTYDWIGFDPRGVGASRPALSCIPDYFHGDRPPYVPGTRAVLRAWLARSRAYAAACGRSQPALLEHMKTTDSARDLESLRAALGADRINYYGFSYGTYLGQVYATMFPSRVRRMVLDANVDPRGVWYRANLDQDVAFDRNIRIWFAWVAQYDRVYHLGSTEAAVRALFYRQETALAQHPADGVLGPDEWADAFLGAGYAEFLWPSRAEAFADWVHRQDPAKVIAAYRGSDSVGDDNGFAVYAAVQCSDVQWPRDWSTWERDNWRIHRIAPFYTWGNAWYNAPCLYWPARAGTPVRVNGHRVAALLVSETLDAATPYPGSLEVRRRFPAASLLAEPGGTTHASSLNGNACVDDTIARYLATGVLPPRRAGDRADALCAPLPRPVPAGSAVGTPTRERVPALLRR